MTTARPVELTTPFVCRFWSYVNQSGDGCWVWTGTFNQYGYGRISHQGRMLTAHRVAFYLTNGRWPSPLGLHGCDNRACVRVCSGHVYEGTHADNTADMMRRGRDYRGRPARGERNAATKATRNKVRAIRALSVSGWSSRRIASAVGLSSAQVLNIVSGKHWGWMQ